MFRARKYFFTTFSLFIISVIFVSCGRSDLAGTVTVSTIKGVKLGMSKEEVITILGRPFSIEPRGFVYGTNAYTMNYSRAVEHARWYPMLWIHLKNNKVVEVYAKRYIMFGADDKGVYGLSDSNHWESVEFDSTFPP